MNSSGGEAVAERAVVVPCDGVHLPGDLWAAPGVRGVVLFAHGSGSSRHSPRNRHVAKALQRAGLATLLIDLLTAEEVKLDDFDASYRFNVPLLGSRLEAVIDWLGREPSTSRLAVGLFGASTGAAAALVAAACQV